jgi:tRNA A37 threonylcarbamoyladenosine synthetase subunit TsaC/SUA5/YrdC
VRRLRGLDKTHNFTLMCCDLSQLGLYAKIDTGTFRLLKAHVPGPYTFILNATREVPRLLLHEKRRTIGLRVPATHHPGAAGRAGRAADEREPDPAGRQRADDRPVRDP